MPDWLVYIGYVIAVAVIVVLSIKLGKYVDIIDAKSSISGAFIGGVMLAAVTSLPELFTSLSAVWIVHENSLVIGNILGSDLINLAFLGVILLVFGAGLKSARFSKYYYVAILTLFGMYGLTAMGLYLGDRIDIGWYNLASPLILILYVLFIYKMPKTSEPDEGKSEETLTLRQAVIRFCICAVILIGASICMTFLTDIVSDKLNLGKTFAGALFLGVATSLPELISSCSLCYRKNYDAAAGNIFGSNIFNFMILFVADTFSFMPNESGVYVLNGDSKWLLLFGALAAAVTLVMLILKNREKQTKLTLAGVYALNVIPPVIYIIYLLMTTGIIGGL